MRKLDLDSQMVAVQRRGRLEGSQGGGVAPGAPFAAADFKQPFDRLIFRLQLRHVSALSTPPGDR